MKTKIPIALSLLWLFGCEAQNSVDTTQPNITNAQCKNLHKVTDIYDLVYQMYSNIDSHCLFEMPTEELERIWEIRVFDNTKGKRHYPYNYSFEQGMRKKVLNENEFKNVSNKKLYIEKNLSDQAETVYLWVGYLDDEEIKIWGSTSPPYPKMLPKPLYFSYKKMTSEGEIIFTHRRWVNSSWDRRKPLLEVRQGTNVQFYDNFLDVETESELPLMNTWSIYHGKKSY